MARIIGTAGSAPAAKPQPRKAKVKVRSTAPPQTPDSRDNNRLARHPPVSHVSPDAQDVAAAALRQHVQQPAHAHGHGPGQQLAVVRAHPGLLGAVGHALGGYVHTVAHGNFGGLEVIPSAARVVGRAAKDAEEMAVTLPSSVVHLADTAIHHPASLPALLAAPYEELAKHPVKSLSEHPLQTALMVAPAVRMPGRAIGKVARVTGKQTLERADATLPGSALREKRTGSRDAVVRAVQSRADRRNPTPTVTARDVRRRVDEYFGAAQRHRQRVRQAAVRDVRQRGLNGDAAEQHISGALGGAQAQLEQRFGREFGAIHQVSPQGHIIAPKGATEGTLHASRAQAERVATRLNARPVTLPSGTAAPAVPLEWSVRDAGDQFAVVPKFAADRLNHHQGVGTTKAMLARMMRVSRRQFTQTVLPFSSKWLTGQAVEAGLRSFLAGAGPTSYLRAGKVVRELERQQPGAGKGLLERATPGGLIGRAAAHEMSTKTLADEFAGSSLANVARSLTHVAATPGIRHVRGVFHAVTGFVFDTLNGRIVEATTQRAMLGKALKNSPLMERKIIGLSDKAVKDAVAGLQATEAQVQLGRAVQRMYGKYSNFGPELRSAIMHWTPFLPWYLNVARFLGHTLPVDHPVATAVLADANALEEEWRKSHRLSLEAAHVPSYLLGGVPVGNGDRFVRVARYTPFGVGEDVSGSFVGLLLPQLDSAQLALHGLDWTGKPLNGAFGHDATQGERFIAAANALIESMVPGVSQAEQIHAHLKAGDSLTNALRAQFDPLKATQPPRSSSAQLPMGNAKSTAPVRVRPVRVRPVRVGRVKPVRVKPIPVKPR